MFEIIIIISLLIYCYFFIQDYKIQLKQKSYINFLNSLKLLKNLKEKMHTLLMEKKIYILIFLICSILIFLIQKTNNLILALKILIFLIPFIFCMYFYVLKQKYSLVLKIELLLKIKKNLDYKNLKNLSFQNYYSNVINNINKFLNTILRSFSIIFSTASKNSLEFFRKNSDYVLYFLIFVSCGFLMSLLIYQACTTQNIHTVKVGI
jgi:hypothetical protein